MAACEELDKSRVVAEVRSCARVRCSAPSAEARSPLRAFQAEEKAAEKAVNEALLKLGNIVHDSVLVDNNEARARSASPRSRRVRLV